MEIKAKYKIGDIVYYMRHDYNVEYPLQKIEKENQPRYETLKWYLEIIGLDFKTVIKRINQIPKLY